VLNFLANFMRDGGYFMWVILLVWLVGLGISFYKFIMLKRNDVNGKKLFDKVKGSILQNNVDEALNLCSGSKAVLPCVLRSGLKRANEDRVLVEDAVATSLMEHTPKLTYHLNYISLIANISTLIGLLGTIQGLIMSFAAVGDPAVGNKAQALANGIAKAMNTTAFGLISAITIMILHTILTSKAIKMGDKIDETAAKLIDLLSVKKSKNV
jgi:biopolymer transport protein ExbB